MGGSSIFQIFEAVSTALQWISKHKFACSHMVHILDDFFSLWVKLMKPFLDALLQFLKLCAYIGFPIF